MPFNIEISVFFSSSFSFKAMFASASCKNHLRSLQKSYKLITFHNLYLVFATDLNYFLC